MKLHKFEECVDWHDITDAIKTKHGIDIDDYAGVFSKENIQRKKEILEKWRIENGYGDFLHVLDVPDRSNPRADWPKDSEEMKMRIEINTKLRDVEKDLIKEVPYLNYWHLICDDVRRGGVNYIYLDYEESDKEDDHSDYNFEETGLPEKYKHWVSDINKLILEEVKDSPAYDPEEGVLRYTADW